MLINDSPLLDWAHHTPKHSPTVFLGRAARAAEEVGAGNLDVHIDATDMEGELEVLTNAFNQMTRQVSGRTRELKKLEELGRAILNGPPDASTLSEVLSEHVSLMFSP